MNIARSKQLKIGFASIIFAVSVQLFNDFACYDKSIFESISTIWFSLIALVPAILFLGSKKPIRAAGAAIVIACFYGFAYYTDCIQSYQGGGASMVYIIVLMYGIPLSILGGFVAGVLE